MKPATDPPFSEDQVIVLEQEIAELEKATKTMGMRSMRLLGLGCSSVSLLTISGLGLLLLPRPIQTGYFVALIIVGLIGIVMVFRILSKKTKESLSNENEQLKDMVAQLNEKHEKLKELRQAN